MITVPVDCGLDRKLTWNLRIDNRVAPSHLSLVFCQYLCLWERPASHSVSHFHVWVRYTYCSAQRSWIIHLSMAGIFCLYLSLRGVLPVLIVNRSLFRT